MPPRKNKYIVIEWDGLETPFIFPESCKHQDVAMSLKTFGIPISAGTCEVSSFGDELLVWTGGKSSSLDLDSRPEDKDVIRRFFTQPEF